MALEARIASIDVWTGRGGGSGGGGGSKNNVKKTNSETDPKQSSVEPMIEKNTETLRKQIKKATSSRQEQLNKFVLQRWAYFTNVR